MHAVWHLCYQGYQLALDGAGGSQKALCQGSLKERAMSYRPLMQNWRLIDVFLSQHCSKVYAESILLI